MTKTINDLDLLGESVLAELSDVRTTADAVGAATAAAALASRRAAEELVARDRIVRIARHEGATLRSLAEATGLSRQTIANICKD